LRCALGPNLRCVAERSNRDAIRSVFTEVFGAAVSHPSDTMDVVSFGDSNIGFEFVADGTALSEDDQRERGVWIEIVVEDAAGTCAQLEALGLKRLEYRDQDRAYYQLPGGPVFRVA
jgi:hypothetical protein